MISTRIQRTSGGFGDLLDAAQIFEQWAARKSVEEPLVLILHFAPDVRQTLLSISQQTEAPQHEPLWPAQNVRWVRGDVLINRSNQEVRRNERLANAKRLISLGVFEEIPAIPEALDRAIRVLSKLPPTLFLLDFSQVRPDMVYPTASDGASNHDLPYVGKVLAEFCAWTASLEHRVVIGLPRLMMGLPDIAEVYSGSPWTFVSAELFSQQYKDRAQRCDQRLGGDGPLDGALRLLLSANSSALLDSVAEFLASLEGGASPHTHADDLSSLPTLIQLARWLTQRGFYEIAYRLEVFCRILGQQRGLISLDADVAFEPAHQRMKDRIVGLIHGAEKTPAVVKHGVLTGEPGAGKTTVLLQMEHSWSLPQADVEGATHPCWVPLFMSVSEEPDLELSRQVQAHLNRHSHLEVDDRSGRYELACHALLARIASVSDLQWLFSSPVYFLVDGIDETSREQRQKLERELAELRIDVPDAGVLVAFRKGQVAQFSDFDYVELRSMSDHQFGECVTEPGRSEFSREVARGE